MFPWPPTTVASVPLAMPPLGPIWNLSVGEPPVILASLPLAVLSSPPLTLAATPLALLPEPPLTLAR